MSRFLVLLLFFSFSSIQLSVRAQDTKRNTYKDNSVLSEGQIYKLAIESSGLYKIDASLLNQLGINGNINPSSITLWSNYGGMIPEAISSERVDDLEQIPLIPFHNGDEVLSGEEKLVFYAEGPTVFEWDKTNKEFNRPMNIYSEESFVFLILDNHLQKTIEEAQTVSNPDIWFDTWHDVQIYEEDKYNLLAGYSGTAGSGKKWFGEIFTNVREQDYTAFFDFNHVVQNSEINVSAEFGMRSNQSSSARIILNNQVFARTVSSVDVTSSLATYARIAKPKGDLFAPDKPDLRQGDFELILNVLGGGSVFESWLDFIRIDLLKNLKYQGKPFIIQRKDLGDYEKAGFRIQKESGDEIKMLDVSDMFTTNFIPAENQNSTLAEFTVIGQEGKRYLIFSEETNYQTPVFIEQIDNQNLHAIDKAEMLIIYHPDFQNAAEKLGNHRRDYSNLNVETVSVIDIYNEFSGGAQDPSALRDFVKMIYDRDSDLKYLCLFGDGSYDYRGINEEIPFSSFIPVFETTESLDPIEAFPTDDYYALLDNNEGGNLVGAIDIAVGRLTVMTELEANQVVDKIIRYDLSDKTLGDWRNRIAFVADDEDSNQHLNQSIELANRVESMHPEFNQQKIFFDAYQQIATIGDERYPDAKEAINNQMFQGLLVLNYFGHGGPSGWAQERVLELADINNWSNTDKLPLFVTATCTFTGYDDPEARSGGELCLLNPNGGSIGLVTTVRAVYSFSNKVLTTAFFDRLFEKDLSGKLLSIGESLQNAKNSNSQDTLRSNARKFTLIGDPALKLAIPEREVFTSTINGNSVLDGIPDTLRALEEITVEGYIALSDGSIDSTFNGTLIPTVFDKSKNISTLGQDPKSYPKSFAIRNNILFKGKASVINGKFSFSFVVPKDIDYRYGPGRISYYAYNSDLMDATGYYENIIIGGTGENGAIDINGPEISLFINDESFVSGGVTGPDPILIVKLFDDFGINVTGNSIGHDMIGILDGDTQNSFVMNEYYEAEKDNYKSGTVRFPFFNLEPGKHHVLVRAWDISNNLAEAEIEFEVIGHNNPVVLNTLSYPNPFIDNTRIQFEHNLAGKDLEIKFDVFDLAGRRVKSQTDQVRPVNYTYSELEWDGTDDSGRRLPFGTYIFRLTVGFNNSDGDYVQSAKSTGKLVLIR